MGYDTILKSKCLTVDGGLALRKRIAIKTAKDLGYIDKFPEVKKRLEDAKSQNEIDCIMSNCRKAEW